MDNYKIYPLVHVGTKYVMTRMQNVIWVARGLALPYMIERDAGNLLAEIIENVENKKPLIVNFRRVTDIDDHALDSFFDAIASTKRSVIILEGNHLFEKIESLKKGKHIHTSNDPTKSMVKVGPDEPFDILDIERERKILFETFINGSIKDCFESISPARRMSSTPIMTNGEFNSNRIIADIKSFIWTVTFLADKLSEIINDFKLPKVRLLCASLRGAPFAAALSLVHGVPLDIIDHLGPKLKILDKGFLGRLETGADYVFVGDFSIGGTEIKVAKTYAEIKGCTLNHALVIGNYIEEDYFLPDFRLHSIVDLKQFTGLASFTI